MRKSITTQLSEKMISESTKEKEDAIEALGRLSKGRTAYYEAGYAIHELASKAEAIYKSPSTRETNVSEKNFITLL